VVEGTVRSSAQRLAEVRCKVAWVALVILGACSGSFGDRVREQVRHSIRAGVSPAVRVDNVAGTVRVTAGSGDAVDVEATKYGNDVEDLRNITVTVRRTGDGVAIASSYEGGVHSGGVRYRIVVPQDASLNVSNVAGAVDVAGIRGNILVGTQAGEITVDAGRVAGERSIDLRATTGALRLTIARQSSARVDAYSTVGAFSSDVPGITAQRENLVGARGGGTIGSGSARISLTTTTGAIELFAHP